MLCNFLLEISYRILLSIYILLCSGIILAAVIISWGNKDGYTTGGPGLKGLIVFFGSSHKIFIVLTDRGNEILVSIW